MKANQPKRKLFNDAVDLLTGDALNSGIQMIPVDQIKPFHEHPFRLYQGERLDDMVESIREHGILTPVIVRKFSSGYEMLAGHNRQNGVRVKGNMAKKLKAVAGAITEETVRSILVLDGSVTDAKKKGTITVKVPADVYHRYFSEADDKDVQKILVEALGLYFEAKGE